MQDNPEDGPGDARWLTFAEFAVARGISRESAIRTVRRKRWRRQKDNHGTVRALIPPDWQIAAPERPEGSPEYSQKDHAPDRRLLAGALAALEDAVTGLRDQLHAARGELGRARDELAEAKAQMERERERADGLRDRLIGAQAELSLTQVAATETRERLQRVQDAAKALQQTEAARKARGLPARLWAALRGQ